MIRFFILSLCLCSIVDVRAQCDLQFVEISPESSAFCNPQTVTLGATVGFDSDPELLQTETSSPDFQQNFTHVFPTQDNGCTYVLRITGSYTVFSNTDDFFDARYRFDISDNSPIQEEEPLNMDITTPLSVLPNGYSPDHSYDFIYTGDGSNIVVEFDDSQLSDNTGSMSFEWLVLPCLTYAWIIDGDVVSTQLNYDLQLQGAGTTDIDFVVTDAFNDCELATSESYTIDGQGVSVTVETEATCTGETTGSAVLNHPDDNPPYSYEFSSGTATGNEIAGLAPGMYGYTVTDNDGCETTGDFTISEINVPEPQLAATPTTCSGSADAVLIIENAPPGFTVLVNDEVQSVDTLTELAAGNYQVRFVSPEGCEAVETVEITANELPAADLTTTPVTCSGEIDGTLVLNDRPAGAEISVDGILLEEDTLMGLSAGQYVVSYVFSEFCSSSQVVTIDTPAPLVAVPPAPIDIEAGETAELILPLADTAQVLIESFGLDFFDLSALVSPSSDTIYTVFLTDGNGCTETVLFEVNVTPNRDVFVPNGFSPNDDGVNDFFSLYTGSGAGRIVYFRVFDRWGAQLVSFEDADPDDKLVRWNGRAGNTGDPLDPGVYVWVAEILFVDGEREQYGGEVLLLR